MTAVGDISSRLQMVGLQNIQGGITKYNSTNKAISYGLAAYVAMTFFLMSSTISTPVTLAVIGGFTLLAKPKERAMVAPLMLSIAARWVFGSTIAVALAAISAVGMTIHNRGISRIGAGAIGVTLLSAVPLPIASIALLTSGALLLKAFERRASLARFVHPIEVFREPALKMPQGTEENSQAVIRGGERQDTTISSKLGSFLLNSYAPVTDIPYVSIEGAQLPEAAIQQLVEKANDRSDIDAARDSIAQAKKYAIFAGAALVVGATIPTFAFVAIGAVALFYEHYNMSLGFGSVAALRYLTGLNPTLLLISAAGFSAYTGKGEQSLKVIIPAVAASMIFNASLGILFAGVALSVPYIAYCITQQERAERYTNAAEALIKGRHPMISKENGVFVYTPPVEGGQMQQRLAAEQNGLLNAIGRWFGFGQRL